jgi:hypothetical protein
LSRLLLRAFALIDQALKSASNWKESCDAREAVEMQKRVDPWQRQ